MSRFAGAALLAALVAACGGEKTTDGSSAGDAGNDGATDASSTGDDATSGGDDASASDALADVVPSGDCFPACAPNEYCFMSYPRADAGDPLDARDPYFQGCLPAPASCGGSPDCACVKNDTYAYCTTPEECIEHDFKVSVTCLR